MFDRPGTNVAHFLSLATFAYNIFPTLNLGNYSPYELVFGRKPRILINIETIQTLRSVAHSKITTHC